jgi:ubiquinone/menaquinone biosynthesis C-methylase UbiE
MKVFYQTEWHNISFSSFCQISSTKLADSDFYNAFYRALFEKYRDYDALDPAWRRVKDEIADWLVASLPDGSRVLSVGCGLGYMEQYLWRKHGDFVELHAQDYASHSLKWLRQVLPADRIHELGDGGGKATEENRYDLIYLSAVDYALSDEDLLSLLSDVQRALSDGGKVLMISASFLEDPNWRQLVRNCKRAVIRLLELTGLRKRGQLWGWMRSREDYQTIMRSAGMSGVADGFLETSLHRIYWIEGTGGFQE